MVESLGPPGSVDLDTVFDVWGIDNSVHRFCVHLGFAVSHLMLPAATPVALGASVRPLAGPAFVAEAEASEAASNLFSLPQPTADPPNADAR